MGKDRPKPLPQGPGPGRATANTPGDYLGIAVPLPLLLGPPPHPPAAQTSLRLEEAAGRCQELQVGQGLSPRSRLGITGLGFLLEQNNYNLPEDLNPLEAMSAGNRLQKQKYICIQSWKEEES